MLWQQSYDSAFTKNQYAAAMANGPNATPLVSGSRLFTFGVTGGLTAWDTGTGTQLWRKDYSSTIDTSKLFCGTAASPILAHGLVVIQVGSDVKGGQIVGLDPATGQAKWTWTGPGPGYASPMLVDIAGVSQLVTMTNGSVIGIDARTGAGLWTIPFPDEWHENIVTHRRHVHKFAGAWRRDVVWTLGATEGPVRGDGRGHRRHQMDQHGA